MSSQRPIAHLVGSIPLADAETVFRTAASGLGAHLARIPDGETGRRINWIRVLQEHLSDHPDMQIDTETPPLQWRQWDGVLLREIPLVRFKDGVDPGRVTFESGYAEDAIASFAVFARLQTEGVIPPAVKFQISIPTPLAPGYNYVSPRAQDEFIPVFTEHLIGEVAAIVDTLPHQQIAIQWDVCQEILMWERYYDYERPAYKEEICALLGRIGDAVPDAIDLGYHLCYGSPRDEHLLQPRDSAVMVEVVHGLLSHLSRPVQFFHMPVPKERDDDAYFAPLESLNRPAGTALYLGLVHYDDQGGNERRLAAARRHVRVDGVGTECGWGRGDPARIPGLLAAHAATLARLAAPA